MIELPAELQRQVLTVALQCYKALKCSVYARIDIILKEEIPYILEVNTLPGLTKNSFFAQKRGSGGLFVQRTFGCHH